MSPKLAPNLSSTKLAGTGPVVPRLTEALRIEISLGALEPGARLKIDQIRKKYDISAASVREALSILTGEEFVTSIDQRGFVVTAYQGERLTDLTRVRAELECIAFGWSVENADTDWRANVVARHFALSEAETKLGQDPFAHALEWDQRNFDFHMALAGACGSNRLIALITNHYDLTRRYRLIGLARGTDYSLLGESRHQSAREHADLKDAALAGDTAAGQAIIRKHLLKHP